MSIVQPRRPAGTPTGGQYAPTRRTHASDIDPFISEGVTRLHGAYWDLPPWEEAIEDPGALIAYAREAAKRWLVRNGVAPESTGFRGKVDLSQIDVEDLAQEVVLRAIEIAEREAPRSTPNFIGGIARNVVSEALRGGLHSSDVKASGIYDAMRAARVQALGRSLSTAKEDDLAEHIRSNWAELGGTVRLPRKGFHRTASDRSKLSMDELETYGMLPIHRESDRLASVRRMRIEAERQAGRAWHDACSQAAAKLGRPLSEAEEDAVARRVLAAFPAGSPARPEDGFHRRSSSFSNASPEAWSSMSARVVAGETDVPKRLAAHMAWGVVAEMSDAPYPKRGELSRHQAESLRRALRTSGGVGRAITDYDEGRETKATAALFAPFDIAGSADRERLVEALRGRREEEAARLYDSAVRMAERSMEATWAALGL